MVLVVLVSRCRPWGTLNIPGWLGETEMVLAVSVGRDSACAGGVGVEVPAELAFSREIRSVLWLCYTVADLGNCAASRNNCSPPTCQICGERKCATICEKRRCSVLPVPAARVREIRSILCCCMVANLCNCAAIR